MMKRACLYLPVLFLLGCTTSPWQDVDVLNDYLNENGEFPQDSVSSSVVGAWEAREPGVSLAVGAALYRQGRREEGFSLMAQGCEYLDRELALLALPSLLSSIASEDPRGVIKIYRILDDRFPDETLWLNSIMALEDRGLVPGVRSTARQWFYRFGSDSAYMDDSGWELVSRWFPAGTGVIQKRLMGMKVTRRDDELLSLWDSRKISLTPTQAVLLRARGLTARKNGSSAVDAWMKVWQILPFDQWTPAMAEGAGRAFRLARDEDRGVTFLTQLADGATDKSTSAAAYAAIGFLCRYSDTARAQASFRTAFELSGDERDRMLWYWWDAQIRRSASEGAKSVGWLMSKTESPAYFDDLLEALAARLLARRDWSSIAGITEVLADYPELSSSGLYGYLTARAVEHGFVSGSEDFLARCYRMACGPNSSLYYRILGSYYSGGEWLALQGEEIPNDILSSGDIWLKTLVRWGRLDEAEEFALEAGRSLTDSGRFFAADYLQNHGKYLSSLRILLRSSTIGLSHLDDKELRLLFPMPNLNLAEIAFSYGTEDVLLAALVRQESGFQADIGSSAGAVGLTQVMPSTGRDVWTRMKRPLDELDLKDPEKNLAVGAWYLNHLDSRVEGWDAALCSYNAGITRVRRWNRRFSDLPPELRLEAIPYAETRKYRRRVLAGACLYGYLYDENLPDHYIRRFFPG